MGEVSGGKAKRDDKARNEGETGADELAAKTPIEEPDTLGALARAESSTAETASADEGTTIQNATAIVQHSFHWFNEAAQQRLEALRGHLEQEDEPDWLSQLASALLEVALGAGAAAAGLRLAQTVASTAGEVGGEFIKGLFEGGIHAGVSAGRAKLAAGSPGHVIDPFIDAQKDGVWGAQMENQQRFIKVGRHRIKTVQQASQLEAACSERNVKAAAETQYDATCDAWLSYLAQARYGSTGARGAVQKDSVNAGATTTNMLTEDARRKLNRSAPGFVPGDAPDLRDAMKGEAPGVLMVVARLPAIAGGVMFGKPTSSGILNGVNDTIRAHYEGAPLADMQIPRHVVATVDGAPDFTLNLDEKGTQCNWLAKKERTWLAARATVGHPEHASRDEWERSQEGLRLLLGELAPRPVKKLGWGS